MLPKTNFQKYQDITLNVLGNNYKVTTDDVTPETSLNTYLRDILSLKGTKHMCLEGGCGACVVVARRTNPETKKEEYFAINSCLVPALACSDWKIDTIEGIGGPPSDNYHVVQKTLADFNGTQCGFCSPGMVMNMYALYEGGDVTMEQVENSFGGNICRCTGYRSILAAFKSICKDADPALIGTLPDIEDVKPCKRAICEKKCEISCAKRKVPFCLAWEDQRWVRVYKLADLLKEIKNLGDTSYRLICGNTGKGVYRVTTKPTVYIDIKDIQELLNYKLENDKLTLGANVSMTYAMDLFNHLSIANTKGFLYLKKLADHIDLIANVPVRNVGSLAGNLMMKHEHNEFPSDMFLMLETAGANVIVVDTNGTETTTNLQDFLKLDMKFKVLKSIVLPSLDETYKYESYKIMPRAQNAHALVNAGFLFKFKNTTVESASIVYGCINPQFIHARNTESYLTGKNLFDNSVLQNAYKSLATELVPDRVLPEPEPEFRKMLAISLFYKTVLSWAPDPIITPTNKSGGEKLHRLISTGVQDFDTNQSLYPVTKPIPKIEALAQTSGQAEYIDDIPDFPNQLHAHLVLAAAPPSSQIKSIDASQALKHPDIVAFYTKDDIPGENTSVPKEIYPVPEEIFCSGVVKFYNQPLGLLVGASKTSLLEAVNLIKVEYTAPKNKPLLTITDILNAKATDRISNHKNYPPKSKGQDVKHLINGTFEIKMQYHYHMETQCCRVVPTEDGIDVYPATQWITFTQKGIANMLNVPANKVNVNVRRCGGGFGAKISRNNLISCAASLAAWKLKKPVSISMSMEDNCGAIGKRFPFYCKYEAGVNDKGVVQYLNTEMYSDIGQGGNEQPMDEVMHPFRHNYNADVYDIKSYLVKSDVPPNTYCRAPGTVEGLGAIEAIMEHIAYELKIDPLELKIANTIRQEVLNYITDLKEWASIDQRKHEIGKFNKENRWKKRGLAIVPMIYIVNLYGPHSVMVTIFDHDGSVTISHSGVEIGQGVNTKAAQVCAYKFGIPLEKINVRPSNSFTSPNAFVTGGSITSEAICYGVIKACDELLKKLEPHKKDTWEKTTAAASAAFVNLSAIGVYAPNEPNIEGYTIYGACATEVLLDVLTGQYFITRVDLLEDTGTTLSPYVDIGQVEGAFVMGLGYFTSEQIVFDDKGKLLTTRTWNYKPPGAKDIPIDFRVKFPKNGNNPVGVMNSKAVGEPPLCMSVSVPLAIRNAVAAARHDVDPNKLGWYPFDGPSSVENVYMNCLTDSTQFVL